MGHSQPNWTVRAMSAFLPLATELRTLLEVRFVPIGDITFLPLQSPFGRSHAVAGGHPDNEGDYRLAGPLDISVHDDIIRP